MFRIRLILILSCYVFCSPTHSQENPATAVVAETSSKSPQGRVGPITGRKWLLGAGLLRWNERIELTQGPMSSSGWASYGGLVVTVDRQWRFGRWFWGAGLGSGVGNASAGSLQGDVAFDDGVERFWTSALLRGSLDYLVNPRFLVGTGVLGMYRIASWEPSDQTVLVKVRPAMQLTADLRLQLRLSKTFSVLQSYSPLGFQGESLWAFSGNFSF